MKPFFITFDDYRRAQKLSLGKRLLTVRLVFFVLISVALTFVSTVSGRRPLFHPVNLFLEVLLFFLIFFVSPLTMKRRLKKLYDSHALLKDENRVSFDDEQLCWETNSGSSQIKWSDMHKAKISPDLILLYQALNLVCMIPARAFEDEDERQQFEKVIRKLVK